MDVHDILGAAPAMYTADTVAVSQDRKVTRHPKLLETVMYHCESTTLLHGPRNICALD
jgi:hypothetical protein